MSEIPSFSYDLLWGERVLRSVANLTRKDGEEFMAARSGRCRFALRSGSFRCKRRTKPFSTCAPANYVAPPCSRSADSLPYA